MASNLCYDMAMPLDKQQQQDMKDLRKLIGQSQAGFAHVLGVSVDSVRKWEQGKSSPSKKAWAKLQKLVNGLKAVSHL